MKIISNLFIAFGICFASAAFALPRTASQNQAITPANFTSQFQNSKVEQVNSKTAALLAKAQGDSFRDVYNIIEQCQKIALRILASSNEVENEVDLKYLKSTAQNLSLDHKSDANAKAAILLELCEFYNGLFGIEITAPAVPTEEIVVPVEE